MSRQRSDAGILQAIIDRKILFTVVFLLFVSTVIVVSLRMMPVYKATSVLLLETKRPRDKMSFLSAQHPLLGSTEIQNEIQVLNSLSLLRNDSLTRQQRKQRFGTWQSNFCPPLTITTPRHTPPY